MKLSLKLIGLVTLLNTPLTLAETSLADRYLDAYRDFDVQKMAEFYSDDAVFIDPTAEFWGGDGFNKQGKETVVAGLNDFVSKFDDINLDFNVDHHYEAAGYNVYTGMAKLELLKKGKLTTSCGRLTTIVSVKEDKVIEHRDYFDYKHSKATRKKGDQDC